MELYDNVVLNRRRRADWELDFSSTYLLHGFSMSHYHNWINPKTILSRTSNFGVATYDAVVQMRKDGIVSGEEDGKELLELPPDMLELEDPLELELAAPVDVEEDVFTESLDFDFPVN
ncbi:hypothetical protein N0V95_009808 [Ascochyta clinopodiicola]|nr:hypothetical protein N0V95_009808 [Ascochyta clinopodiicola]